MGWNQEKSQPLGVVTFGGSDQTFPVSESYFHLPAMGYANKLLTMCLSVMFWVGKFFHREYGFEFSNIHFLGFISAGGFRWKNPALVTQG